MTQNFDEKMKAILSEGDAEFIGDTIDETGFYKSVWGSFGGKGSGMSKMAWAGIIFFGMLTIVSIWQMLVAETLRLQLIWATFGVLGNSAQIGMKIWFNMQLNRRALSHEIRRLQLAVMAKS